LFHPLQENPAISDPEFDELAAEGLRLFGEMSVEDRARLMRGE
jgi:hypothetical protein